mmetsp:Transcript_12238/g.17396  ORF Transcript_12238/g.17396 Transcript_12238/m.17396 type:complete len:224 (-) Transcript_12238:143-814(-)
MRNKHPTNKSYKIISYNKYKICPILNKSEPIKIRNNDKPFPVQPRESCKVLTDIDSYNSHSQTSSHRMQDPHIRYIGSGDILSFNIHSGDPRFKGIILHLNGSKSLTDSTHVNDNNRHTGRLHIDQKYNENNHLLNNSHRWQEEPRIRIRSSIFVDKNSSRSDHEGEKFSQRQFCSHSHRGSPRHNHYVADKHDQPNLQRNEDSIKYNRDDMNSHNRNRLSSW